MTKAIRDWEFGPGGLTRSEINEIVNMLEIACHRFANLGCNDHRIIDTPENRDMLRRYNKFSGEDENNIHVHDGLIIVQDFVLMAYLRDRVRETLSLCIGE